MPSPGRYAAVTATERLNIFAGSTAELLGRHFWPVRSELGNGLEVRCVRPGIDGRRLLPVVILSFGYVILSQVLHLLILMALGDRADVVEVLVLRHQVAVLRRRVRRADLEPADRAGVGRVVVAVAAGAVAALVVTAATLLG